MSHNPHQVNTFPDTRYFDNPNDDGDLKRNGHSNGPSDMEPMYPEGALRFSHYIKWHFFINFQDPSMIPVPWESQPLAVQR